MNIRANFSNEEGWKRYLSAVSTPIGFADIIGRIVTGVTTATATKTTRGQGQGLCPYSLAQARDDMSLLADNTRAYWTWEAQEAGERWGC